MINKTYPTRHRLVLKNKRGTAIERKPYQGQWGSVLGALGLSLTSTILFANHVLLTEGDSDPIYIHALLQKLVACNKISADLNSFSAMSTGQVRNADSLIRLLMESVNKPKIALLLDGDMGGTNRLADLSHLLERHKIPHHTLSKGTAIEDHLPSVGVKYVNAVANYITKLMIDRDGVDIESDIVRIKCQASFVEQFGETESTEGVATWASEIAMEIGKLKNPPSKIGIAREYVALLDDIDISTLKLRRTSQLAKLIQQNLKLPVQVDATDIYRKK